MFQVTTPQSSEDWQAYYQLRWEVLRAPWNEPRGSEQDDMEQDSEHRFIKNNNGDVLGVARLHFNNHEQAQVRYMASSCLVGSGWVGLVYLRPLRALFTFVRSSNLLTNHAMVLLVAEI